MWCLPVTTARKGEKAKRKIADLQAELDAANRTVRVLEAERDAMAAVIARDRMRVAAETAEYGRKKAEAESGRAPSRV